MGTGRNTADMGRTALVGEKPGFPMRNGKRDKTAVDTPAGTDTAGNG